MSITKSLFFLFSLKLKISFFVGLAPFFTFQGPKLEFCKLPKPWKTQGKKSVLYVTDMTLQTLHYGHYIMDIMTA